MKKALTTLTAIAAITALSLPLSAQSVHAQLMSADPSETVTGQIKGAEADYISGVLNFTAEQVAFLAFCVEPSQTITIGTEIAFTLSDPASLPNSDQLGRVVTKFLASSQSANEAAAAQWAIWELVEEGNPSTLKNGSVKIKGDHALRVLADSYLTDTASPDSFSSTEFSYWTNEHKQDVMAWTATSPIPEPSTALLLLAGLASGLVRHRR